MIALLSAVLALNSADLGTVGAVAAELEHALHIDNLEVGLAAAAVSLAATVATLPVGWLTDRVPRVPLMASSIVLWSAAMIATGAATSFVMLLASRVFLGAVQATAGPTLAALTGDLFAERERSRIFGFIHAGELVGAGFGFVVSGEVAAVLSWRWSFWLLSIPGFLLAVGMWRGMPEPERTATRRTRSRGGRQRDDIVHQLVAKQHIEPDPGLVLREDPAELSVGAAVRHLLRIPTNMILVGAMACEYFFLGGAQTFGVIFFRGQYGLGQAAATAGAATLGLGALVGVLVAGRLADRMLAHARLDARVTIGAAGFIAAAVIFVPPIVTTQVVIALPVFLVAAAALMAPTAPLEAALLDVIPPAMWGRAEGIQTAARTLTMALAPILFGFASQVLAGRGAGFGQSVSAGSTSSSAAGLETTFLIALGPILVAGLALLWARRRYPRDIATMQASAGGG